VHKLAIPKADILRFKCFRIWSENYVETFAFMQPGRADIFVHI